MSFLVDGLNLYFSLLEAESTQGIPSLRWLDLRGLLRSYLSAIGPGADISAIHFFTAIPSFRQRYDPSAVHGHEAYLQTLGASGVHLHVAAFKKKSSTCPHCGKRIERYEEKETDVALGMKAMELLHLGACDTLVFVSGDTDFAPALRTAKRLFPANRLCVAFPHARFNAELQQLADFSFRIRGARYVQHQLPDPVMLPDGRRLRRPRGW
ncbi:NYN domain-containing protein [Gemmatimonadota bacterium]